MIKASIITIGDEILIGQIVDTNSASIARHLNTAGITVEEKLSIGDDASQIVSTLNRSLTHSQIIIITGGLGPTKDDITKHALADFFHSTLIKDEAVAEHVCRMLTARGIEYNALNQSQSLVPECCTVLHNAYGTAPGMWFDTPQRGVVVSLPGVPFEMEHLMDDVVVPRLAEHFDLRSIVHRTLITRGIAESILAERIAAWEDALPEYMHLAYLPAPNIVRLRLSAYDVDKAEATKAIECEFNKLSAVIGDNIVGYEGESIEHLIHQRLSERGLTLAVAESCTGGAIASKFTAMAGASQYFLAGVVSYSNESKRDILGVRMADIVQYGAVSEEVARQMAEGVRRITGSDYALATTGIAGPGGGSEAKPIGTVWMALATPTATYAQMRNSGNDRGQVISRATAYALDMLYDELKKLF